MHKNTLCLIFAILFAYFSLVFCEDSSAVVQELEESKHSNNLLVRDTTALEEEARARKKYRHYLFSLWGFYGLAIAFLIKIKVAVVAFFVGSAIYTGLRYWWPQKCAGGEIYKEGSIVLNHPPSFEHHGHIPYSLDHDHHYDIGSLSSSGSTSFEPYSAYSSHSFSESDGSFPSHSYTVADGPHESAPTFRRKRSDPKATEDNNSVKDSLENLARQIVLNEERIGEFMFDFLGLDTKACRRRFVCEMEFRAKTNSLTAMAFRVIGRSLFAKYINNQQPLGKANTFEECAAVNAECVFIENNEEETEAETGEQIHYTGSEEQVDTSEVNSLDSKDVVEKENDSNLKAELSRYASRRHLRGDRHLKLLQKSPL